MSSPPTVQMTFGEDIIRQYAYGYLNHRFNSEMGTMIIMRLRCIYAKILTLSCKIDSSAVAQIIYDIGNTYFWENNGRIEHVFEKTTRIQILDKAGYHYAKVEIPYYIGKYGKEVIYDFTVTSYNYQNGEIISETVDKKVLYEDEINKRWKRKKYVFSKVKEGTIIEYSYIISSPYNVHLPTWFFQHDIPVLHSKYKFRACQYYSYIVLNKGFMEYDIDTVYTEPFGFEFRSREFPTRVYEWELNDVPAFKDESFVPSDDEYKMKVEFQLESYRNLYGAKFELMTTWEQLIDELLNEIESFGTYIRSAKKDVRKIVSELQLEGKPDSEKIAEILRYVKNNYYWNKNNDIYATQTKKKFIDSKTGNVADINLFLHSLLKEADIESNPILISTRNHGKVYYKYPFLSSFNYVDIMVNDETGNYYIDATDPLLPLGMLPKACINGYGLQITKVEKGDDILFFPLSPVQVDLTQMHQYFTINLSDKSVERQVQMKQEGYKALYFRVNIKKNGVESIHNDLTMKSPIEIIQLEVENLEDIEEPLVLKYSTKNDIEIIGDKIFITPFPANEYKENKLKQENRVYPVNFGNLSEEQLFFNLAIPDNYELDYVPEANTIINSELKLEYSYKIQKMESFVQIMLNIKRGKTEYHPDEYKELKTFYDTVVKSINENIVLKKI